jgi:mono/diheme cytochrome c family protein
MLLKKSFLFLLIILSGLVFFVAASGSKAFRAGMSPDKPWLAPKWADTLVGPNVADPTFVQNGRKTFVAECVVCHGEAGRGDGEAGFGLSVPPGDLNDANVVAESNGSLFWKISNGRSPMPAYNHKYTDSEIWQLVGYIRSMQNQYLLNIENKKNRKNK